MLATIEELRNTPNYRQLAHWQPNDEGGVTFKYRTAPLSEEDAHVFLDQIKKVALNSCGFSKHNRPWVIVNFAERLPADEIWLGVEVELGLGSASHRDKLVEWVWDNTLHTAMDEEGQGTHCRGLEVTFAPEPMSSFDTGSSYVQEMYDYLQQGEVELYITHVDVGTHFNISTPKIRSNSMLNRKAALISGLLMHGLTQDQNLELFGRSKPYGYCNARGAGYYMMSNPVYRQPGREHPDCRVSNEPDPRQYLEFKLCRSTPDIAQFRRYLSTVRGLAALSDWVMDIDDPAITDRDDVFTTYIWASGSYNPSTICSTYLAKVNVYETIRQGVLVLNG